MPPNSDIHGAQVLMVEEAYDLRGSKRVPQLPRRTGLLQEGEVAGRVRSRRTALIRFFGFLFQFH